MAEALAALALGLDRDDATPLQVQLYQQIRGLILSGRLPAGARLPATRALAAELGVSRTTALAAYDQLSAEGYLESRRGAGAFVPAQLPDPPPPVARPATAIGAAPLGLSARGAALAAPRAERLAGVPFDPGAADLRAFPYEVWARLLARAWRAPAATLRDGAAPGGYPPLCAAIAAHLRAVRGLPVTAEQVIVTAGLAETLRLLAGVLLDPGDGVWMEEPGYPLAARLLARHGARVTPVPVDGQGLDVAAGRALDPAARLALVTPSHHHPLGHTLSLARRLALLEWAGAAGGWIVEDDYDSEYRYAGPPLAALMSLDGAGRVIYVGSFSKVMFRSLRLAYLVAPAALAAPLRRAQAALGAQASLVPQAALAGFMESGRFAAHVRRMRRLYGQRQRDLLQICADRLDGLLTVQPADAGMHAVADLTPGLAARMDDVTAARRAAGAGVAASAVSPHYAGTPARQGLLLGFGCADAMAMDAAARKLAAALRD